MPRNKCPCLEGLSCLRRWTPMSPASAPAAVPALVSLRPLPLLHLSFEVWVAGGFVRKEPSLHYSHFLPAATVFVPIMTIVLMGFQFPTVKPALSTKMQSMSNAWISPRCLTLNRYEQTCSAGAHIFRNSPIISPALTSGNSESLQSLPAMSLLPHRSC